MKYENSLSYAQRLDQEDDLRMYRDAFLCPRDQDGQRIIYFCGNSLGLQPRSTRAHVIEELDSWENRGIEGYFEGKRPWLSYHEELSALMSEVVGAKPEEVIVMNTLSVNLHLMLVSFYQPRGKRCKVMIESDVFPSHRYAIESQIKLHGLSPSDCIIDIHPRAGEICLREEDIIAQIEAHGDEVALVLLGNTNYYTGQYFDMKSISTAAHAVGSYVGFDCAHAAGNLPLDLHDSGCDFAVWCTYKYLNSGPGSPGGAFVHIRHQQNDQLPRLAGWWGHDESKRFDMRDAFDPMPGAAGWQLSCPTVLALAGVRASLRLIKEAGGIHQLRQKSIGLTGYLAYLLHTINDDRISIITPTDHTQRGAQLSISIAGVGKSVHQHLLQQGVITDWREPDVMRVAPASLYNTYEEVYRFYQLLADFL